MSSIRGKRAPDGFRNALVAHFERQAKLVEEAYGGAGGLLQQTRQRVAALKTMATRITGLDLGDHRLWSLWIASSHLGGDRMTYVPGTEQQRLMVMFAQFTPGFDPEESLNELVAAAMEDLAATHGANYHRVARELELAKSRQTKAERQVIGAANDKAKLAQVRAERDRLEAEVAELRAQLRAVVSPEGADALAEELSAADEPPIGEESRRAHPTEPNVYVRQNRQGEVTYEVRWDEGSGSERRQRRKTTGPNLDDAIALRDKLREEGKIEPPPEEESEAQRPRQRLGVGDPTGVS